MKAEKKEEMIRKSFPEYVDRIPSLHIKARMSLLQNLCKSYNRKHRVYEKECIRYIIKNRKKFSSVYASEKRFFKIITYRLYWAHKLMHNLKKKFKKL